METTRQQKIAKQMQRDMAEIFLDDSLEYIEQIDRAMHREE